MYENYSILETLYSRTLYSRTLYSRTLYSGQDVVAAFLLTF